MNELGGALRDLAYQAPPAETVDADELWVAGRRRVRRQRLIGVAVAAALAVLVGTAALVVPAPVVVMPAGEVHTPGFPTRVYTPSRWLAGTDDKGPLGQLALITGAPRHDGNGIVGVSATTGEYRFLDLPGFVEGTTPDLAPDGKHVAYWITGKPSGKAYPPPAIGSESLDPVVGVGIYDTVTGKVERAVLETKHGLSDEPVKWISSDTVIFGNWQLTSRTSSTRTQVLTWTIGERDPVVATAIEARLLEGDPNGDGSYLVRRDDGESRDQLLPSSSSDQPGQKAWTTGWTVALPATVPGVEPDGGAYFMYSASSGGRVAMVPDTSNSVLDLSSPLVLGRLYSNTDALGVTDLQVVDDLQEFLPLGWHDAHTLLAYANIDREGHLVSVDVRTGDYRVLGPRAPNWAPGILPATDLLKADLVPGSKPPNPIDPRWKTAGLTAGALLLVCGAGVFARRRRRG